MATRWGIIGTGNIAFNFVNCLKSLGREQHKVVRVADRCRTSAARFGQEHGVSCHGSHEELAADKNIDVAYVGVLNPFHHQAVKMMLAAGKNVVCEKPMGMNAREVADIGLLAKQNNVFLLHAIWSRFFPVYSELRQIIDSGELGEINMVQVTMGRDMRHVERVQQKELGGSVLLDVGIYALQLISLIYDETPEKIVAAGHLNKTAVDESLGCTFLYKGNRTANMVLSSTRDLANDAYIFGTKGHVKICDPFWCPTTLVKSDGQKVIHHPLPDVGRPLLYPNSEGLVYEAIEVRNCLNKGLLESPLMKNNESLQITTIMDEIRRQIGVEYDCDNFDKFDEDKLTRLRAY